MALAAGSQPPMIDRLDPVTRKKCIDLLLSGAPGAVGKVANLAGVSRQVVSLYKRNHLGPAVRTAAKILQTQQVSVSPETQIAEQANMTRQVIAASPFRDRLESLWGVADRSITKAEDRGELGVIAPLLNQAHKNLELLGQVTGELQAAAPAGTSSTFVLIPIAIPTPMQALPMPEAQDVEWREVKDGE